MSTTQGGLYGLHMIKPVHVLPIDVLEKDGKQ
jgi:hypothetical protein